MKVNEPERPGICELQNDGFGCQNNIDHKNFDKKILQRMSKRRNKNHKKNT